MMNPSFLGAIAQSDSMSRGLAIAGTGLLIVFAVLILISLFIAALPNMVAALHHVLPDSDHSHADHAHSSVDYPESQLPDDFVIAAIGFVLHSEIQRNSNGKQSGN